MSIFNLKKGLNRLEPIKIEAHDPFRNTVTSRSINISKPKNNVQIAIGDNLNFI